MIAINSLIATADSPLDIVRPMSKVVNRALGLRLAAARQKAKLSQPQLAEMVGMTQSAIAEIEGGRVKRPKKLREIARAIGQTEEWLLDEPARPLISSYDPDQLDPLEQHGDDRPEAAPHRADFPKDAILEAAPRGGMGAGETALTAFSREVDGVSEVDAIRPDYWRFPQRFLNETLRRPASALLVIECEGDSMQPTLAPGERVWVDTTHKIPSPDGIYAMRDRFENVVVKRLQLDESGDEPMILIISDNTSHSTTKRRLADVHIFGKVVGGFRMF
jgi:phage repressor protein C with HTH and peptisase S24 domain